MATQTFTKLVDDLDGSDAAGTVEFSLDGQRYAIDLRDKHRAGLEKALGKYVSAARKIGGRGRRRAAAAQPARRGSGRGGRPRATAADPAEVRAWAAQNGIAVSDRGRLSQAVIEQYRAATAA